VAHLKARKVLVVLDDVWQREHLQLLNFVTVRGCHQDSTFVVTSRDERVLHDAGGYAMEKNGLSCGPPVLSAEYASLLPRHHAFESNQVPVGFQDAVSGLVAECKGLLLALQVLGASMRGKDINR
jgi:NB-ARC domain